MGVTNFDGISVNSHDDSDAGGVVHNTKLDTRVPKPAAGNTSMFLWSNGSATSWQKGVSVMKASLTAAQIKALNATPIDVLIAPGASKFYALHGIIFDYHRVTASFTNGGGGNLSLKMGTTSLVPDADITAIILLGATTVTHKNITDGSVLTPNTKITLSKATAEFAGTTAAGTLDIYFLVTILDQTY